MFRRKKGQPTPPTGVLLDITVNLVIIGSVLDNPNNLSINSMSSDWSEENCVTEHFAFFVAMTRENAALVLVEPGGWLQRTLNAKFHLPHVIKGADHIEVSEENGWCVMECDNNVIMGFPLEWLANLTLGKPVAEYNNMPIDRFGAKTETTIDFYGQAIPIIQSLAEHWFKCENNAIKIRARPINLAALPIKLAVGRDGS